MLVTEVGISIEARLVQPEKAHLSMLVTEARISIEVRLVQF